MDPIPHGHQLIRSFFMGLVLSFKKKPKLKTNSEKLVALLAHHGINLVLDVGANEGQYARDIISHGYNGDIISFEPLEHVYTSLQKNAERCESWQVAPMMAIGAESGQTEINVSKRSDMSSILDIKPSTLEALSNSEYTQTNTVNVKSFDDIADEYLTSSSEPFLKVDTQGFEMNVLRGAENSLKRLKGIQLELSLLPLYEGESLFHEITPWLYERGFESHFVIPGYFSKKLMRQMQVDVVYFKAK